MTQLTLSLDDSLSWGFPWEIRHCSRKLQSGSEIRTWLRSLPAQPAAISLDVTLMQSARAISCAKPDANAVARTGHSLRGHILRPNALGVHGVLPLRALLGAPSLSRYVTA